MNNMNTPELPEGFALYGKGPLKVPSEKASPDIIFWDPSWGTYGWDRSSYRGSVDFGYYALRIGSEIWKANGMDKKYRMLEIGEVTQDGDEVKPVGEKWCRLEMEHLGRRINPRETGFFPVGYYRRPVEKLLLVTDEMDELQAAISSPAYKQLEGEFIQQRDALAVARNRIVDLERRILAEAEEAAQRIISLEDECKRLTELWHGAEGRLALMAEARNNALAAAQGWETGCRQRADELEAAKNETLEVREAWDKDHKEMKRRLDAVVRERELAGVDLSAYGNLVTKLAEALGMSIMEISLDEVLERVKKLVAAKSDLSTDVLLRRVDRLARERDNWEQTAALHLRNECFYRDLLGQCAELLGDECRRSDDGKLIPRGDFLALKVPEVLKERLEHVKMLTADYNRRTELGHNLFGTAAPFEGALTIGQDVVLDGMKWMRDEIHRLRGFDKLRNNPRFRELVATELGKATNNILKGL